MVAYGDIPVSLDIAIMRNIATFTHIKPFGVVEYNTASQLEFFAALSQKR